MKLLIIFAIASIGVIGALCQGGGWEHEERDRSGGYGSRGSVIGLSRGVEVGRHRRWGGEEEERWRHREREEEERRRHREREEEERRREWRRERWEHEGERRREGRRGELGFGGSHFITPVDVHHEEVVHLKARPEFGYDYRVRDHRTHDIKSKEEHRDGDRVKGRYSLLEPDRKTVRVVDYTSDRKRGFVARVTWRRSHE